jgi:diguanylate cyclase (GGDEF)-like protein
LVNGLALALGAPAGMLLLHMFSRRGDWNLNWIAGELDRNLLDYTYLTVSTATVFAILGLRLGTREEQLQASALIDPLTGLWNRRQALNRLNDELARARRYNHPLSILFIDIDWLKRINDDGGHAAGDEALKTVAEAIRRSCRVVDLAARYGGDEYLVIASNTSVADGTSLGERIRTSVKDLSAGRLSVSIGVADLGTIRQADVTTLCQAADEALYQAKHRGRDQVARAASLPNQSQLH